MNVMEGMWLMSNRVHCTAGGGTGNHDLKLGMALSHIRSHYVRCSGDPGERELLSASKMTGGLGIRMPDLVTEA